MKLPKSYDVIGNIAILKFPEKIKAEEKKRVASKLLHEMRSIKTVFEKTEKIKGKLRKLRLKHLAGIKKTETIHKESGCLFKVDVKKCYFSPRLSDERIVIARKVKMNDKVLVMFGGVAPYAIVISKLSRCKKIVSVEIGKECCKYARENIKLNKLNNVEIIKGDVKKVIKIYKKEKFDVVVMPRPNLKEDFLKEAFLSVSKRGKFFYRVFGKNEDLEEMIEKIKKEAKKRNEKVKILSVRKSGEIAPYKYRWMVEFKLM